ncbi:MULTISPECIES: LysM peptidoglycan-binding domain-containing protein [Cysteiniphilum]|uniref:LysM peptidoglycan-binding domain-containing protein n=1 Tax=Cysteiniphilum TaxID=2056696 RepID=UPI0017859801|nr:MULTISPECIES: LysM peptidoglycan-binding domain-containing protein [Cysteiniphilum]
MQKKLYILAAGILLLAGCAQFSSQHKESTTTAPTEQAIKDNTSSTVSNNDKTTIDKASSDNNTTKIVEAIGAPETKTKEISSIANAVDNDQPVTYKVEIGDSLYSIARKNNISMTCLSKANKITDPNRLAAGQTLIIPKPADC